jgi:hypothetical protein
MSHSGRTRASPHGTSFSSTSPPVETVRYPLSLHGKAARFRSPHGTVPPPAPSGPAISAPTTATCRNTTRDNEHQRCEAPTFLRSSQRARLRSAPSATIVRQHTASAIHRASLWEDIRLRRINRALSAVGLTLPAASAVEADGLHYLNTQLQTTLSEFVRRTRIKLPDFVELLRGQTADDYRPNKSMVPSVLSAACQGYDHLPCLLDVARSGVRVPLSAPIPRQTTRPPNHGSANDRYNILVKNIRKKQDAWWCIVVDDDILEIWPEVHIGPLGVVNKGSEDPQTVGRVIHDLSYPAHSSLNDLTDRAAVCSTYYERCDAVAAEIVRQRVHHPGSDIKEQAGDVASAYRHVCIHSHNAYLFGGRLHRDNALVIDMSAAFGWSGSPGNYGAIGGAISFIHGHTTNELNPRGFFNYHWVDDHVNVGVDVGSNCQDIELSLRFAMLLVLDPAAINEEKFTVWNSRLKALRLIFESVAGTVSMPPDKVTKSISIVTTSLTHTTLRRPEYRSILGWLLHVTTCVCPARAFLQRLR